MYTEVVMNFLNLKRKGKSFVTLNFFEKILKKRNHFSKIQRLLNMNDFDEDIRYSLHWKRTIKAFNSLPKEAIKSVDKLGEEFQVFRAKEKEKIFLLKTAYIELLAEIIEKSDKERKI